MWRDDNKHLLICREVQRIYLDDPETHVRYRLFRSLLEFVDRIGKSEESIAAVIDLMHLPGRDNSESDAINYLLENRQFLFFASAELWTAIGNCYCDSYTNTLRPVGLRIKLYTAGLYTWSDRDFIDFFSIQRRMPSHRILQYAKVCSKCLRVPFFVELFNNNGNFIAVELM